MSLDGDCYAYWAPANVYLSCVPLQFVTPMNSIEDVWSLAAGRSCARFPSQPGYHMGFIQGFLNAITESASSTDILLTVNFSFSLQIHRGD